MNLIYKHFQYFTQKGVTHVLVLIAALGLIAFIIVASSAEFKDRLFSLLFPKPPSRAQTIWMPALNTSWQWQLTGLPVNESVDALMFDIDLFDNEASVVASLHTRGKKVICYMSAGSWENWRPDANQFPDSVKGNDNGWPGEKWLDIRRLEILGPIMRNRMDLCLAKGFDGIEPDNVDGYTNNTGFPLTYQDQITYNTFFANEAHQRGLSIGLKNDIDQVRDLVSSYDWALNEQCFQYNECNTLLPFIQAGKAVFNVEYSLDTNQFCPQANEMNFNSLKKNLNLDAFRIPCREPLPTPEPSQSPEPTPTSEPSEKPSPTPEPTDKKF